MNKNNIIDILSNCDFDGLSSLNYEEKIIKNIPETTLLDVQCGATKVVLFFKDYDKVIKIPLNQTENGIKFMNAPYDGGFDYCKSEVNIYKEAKNKGLEELFLEMKVFAVIKGYPIYSQSYGYSYLEKMGDINNEDTIFDKKWIKDFKKYYSEEKYKELLSFINSNMMVDFHTDNYGYQGKKPVLIDYSTMFDG